MRRRALILIGGVFGLLAVGIVPAGAQLPVIDAANLSQNTISATNLIIHTAKWVIDLTPLEGFDIADMIGEDLRIVSELATEAAAIGFSVSSVQAQMNALFALESAPITSFGYSQRVREINQQMLLIYGYAMRTKTLIFTLTRVVEHVMGLIRQVAGLLGKLSAQQNAAQQLAKLQQFAAEANLQQAAFEYAESQQALIPGVLVESLRLINQEMMSDHPR
jgi:hypothetical protein